MLCGIFVGGRASRMGGISKGLLPAPETGEPLVARLARIAVELGCEPVLVGASHEVRAALPRVRTLDDRPAGIGPLGGLAGLLHAAAPDQVLALACDLPLVSRALLAQLVDAKLQVSTEVLAIRSENGLWEPLCARYDARVLAARVEQAIARGVRSFQQLFAELSVEELVISASQQRELCDWDTPEDVTRVR
jgi:molybdopterin-guanine dinucleotide biosynthesis protein A